jgi:hypothetical protein
MGLLRKECCCVPGNLCGKGILYMQCCGSRSSFLSQCGSGGSQNNADLEPGQTLKSQKAEFLQKNILEVGNRSKNIPTKVQTKLQKAF